MWPQVFFSVLFVCGYFATGYFLVRPETIAALDKSQWIQGVLTTILGVLTAAIPQILGFWFGSSTGSKEKTRELIDQPPKDGGP